MQTIEPPPVNERIQDERNNNKNKTTTHTHTHRNTAVLAALPFIRGIPEAEQGLNKSVRY